MAHKCIMSNIKEEVIILVRPSFSFMVLFPQALASGGSFHYLKKRYDLITVDLPGFGRSGKVRRFVYSFENYAAIIIALLQQLGIKNANMVGHSMGGQVALYAALKQPELIRSIILLSSSGYLKKVKKHYIYASYLPFARAAVRWWIQSNNYEEVLRQVVYNKKNYR